MKKIVAGLMVPVLALSLTTGIESAEASKKTSKQNNVEINSTMTKIPEKDVLAIQEFFNKYNVDLTTQNDLLNKLEKGEVWDSLKENTQPINIIESSDEEGNKEQIEVYEDGSISVTTIAPEIVETFDEPFEQPLLETPTSGSGTGLIQPMDVHIGTGTVTSGSGYRAYKHVQVRKSIGIADAHFYADFTLVQGGMDFIQRVYDYKLVGQGGSANFNSLRIVRAKETQDYKASAKLDFTFVLVNGAGSTSCWLKLFVGKDTYSSAYSY